METTWKGTGVVLSGRQVVGSVWQQGERMKRVSAAIGAGLLTLGFAGAAGLLGATSSLASVKPHAFAGTITVKATKLSLTKSVTLKISGAGFTEGDLVIFSICNADATLPDPAAQLEEQVLAGSPPPYTSSACDPLTNGLAAPNAVTVGKSGKLSVSLTINAGQQGTNALSECPQTSDQVAEGVECVIGGEVFEGPDAGSTVSAGMWFASPALTTSDAYTGEGTALLAATADYDVTVSDIGGGGNSGYPPVATANGVPNWGGFATVGLICTVALPTCDPEGTVVDGSFVPTSCQAASTPGATPWSGETGCTFGAAVGEPIEVEASGYTAPAADPTLLSGLPLSTPLDCTASGCTVSANAGFGASDPGGFSFSLTDVTPGKYEFEAIGGSSLQESKGSVTLLLGPTT